ncbi:hypothetical protein MVEN_00413200 [Mycena venus]|uniref:F-box domain-containing protein n=1 Tax=Mycena venus TaxID=2733690 RepID=A0A8H6YV11_9AGAR|nr:hypothetical protein MVEN_00413200 [Mycena venus]
MNVPMSRLDITLILEQLLTISSRWRSLRISFSVPPEFMKRLAEYAMDNLEEVDFYVHHSYNLPTTLSFGPAPRLRKVSLGQDMHVCMPWSQLTDLDIHPHSPQVALDTLAQCNNLVTASVHTAAWAHPPQSTEFTLKHLRTLSLTFLDDNGQHFMPLLDHLSAPALEHLHLTLESNIIWMEAQFTDFQLRSPNITRLEMEDVDLTSTDLRAVLSNTPSLTHLKLTYCPRSIDDTLFHTLLYQDGATPLVPRLHTLFLDLMSSTRIVFSEDVLASMIASRWWKDTEPESSSRRAVARWTSVELRREQWDFSRYFMGVVQSSGVKALTCM